MYICGLRYPAYNEHVPHYIVILSIMASPPLQHFSTLSHKWHKIRGGDHSM